MSAGKAVFLSYAREDIAVARRIAEALRASGVEVWFDENELRGGDAWDAKIRQQIKECALFMPVISAGTQARTEGYFRREWRMAVERTRDMADDAPFLVPVVIDDTPDGAARVPECFRERQWTRLNDGVASHEFCARVQTMLAGNLGTRTPSSASASKRPGAAALPAARTRRHLPLLPTLGAALVLATGIAVWQPWKKASAPSTPSTKPTASLTEGQTLVAKAWEQLNLPELYRTELEIADDLCKRASTLNPDDAEAWATWSHVDCWYSYYGLDTSEARREAARAKVNRALKLDPRSFEVRFAESNYLVRAARGSATGSAPAFATDAVTRLRELLQERPNEARVWFALGISLRNIGKFDEALEAFNRMGTDAAFAAVAWSEKGWLHSQKRDYVASLAACNESIALHPFRGNLLLRINLSLAWTGDLELAKVTLARVPPHLQQEDDFAGSAARVHWWRREPAEMRRVLNTLPKPWLTWGFMAPKSYFIGEAQRMAGEEEAAKAAWREALPVIEDQIAKAPDSARMLYRKARLLGLVGRIEEGKVVLRLARASGIEPEPQITAEFSEWSVALALGDHAEALNHLEKGYEKKDQWMASWAMLRHNPLLDPLRDEPRFKALLARAEADPQRCPHAKVVPTAGNQPAPDQKSIAVLAFENLSGDKDNEYFSDGLSEELLNALAKVPGLRVAARTSSFHFKGRNVPIQQIAQQLGVTHVVEGTVRRLGDQVRITATLINAADGFQLWTSGNLNRDLKDIFALQDEISGTIASKLKLTLTGAASQQSAKRHTDNIEAYEEVLKGRFHVEKYTASALNLAISHYRKALAKQPDYALAYAGLANAYGLIRYFGYVAPGSVTPQFREVVATALRLDDMLPEAHVSQAALHTYVDHEFAAADREFRRALTLDPVNVGGHIAYGLFLSAMCRHPEALAMLTKAQQLDPLSVNSSAILAWARYFAQDVDGAIAEGRRAIAMSPNHFNAHEALADALFRKGLRDEAIKQLEEACRLESPPQTLGKLGTLYARAGRPADARRVLAQLLSKAQQQYVPTYNLARLYESLGDNQAADEWMNKAIADREGRVLFLKAGADDVLRANPLYPKWLRQIGLEP